MNSRIKKLEAKNDKTAAYILSNQKFFKNLYKEYRDIIQQTTKLTSYIRELDTELKNEISKVKQFSEYRAIANEYIKQLIEQHRITASFLLEHFLLQIKFWQDWAEQNRAIFYSYTKFWEDFQLKYKIAAQDAVQILRKYKWFITPSLPFDFVFKAVKIGRRGGNQCKTINRSFVDYLTSNDFGNLETLVGGWETNIIFKPRMKILGTVSLY